MNTGSLQSMTDGQLVSLVLRGETQAYDVLVKRFRRAVILVAEQTLRSREVAEDLAQEVLLVALQSLPHLRDPERFSNWLYAITRYRARRVMKQEQRTLPLEPEYLHQASLRQLYRETAQPEATLLNAQLRDELACALVNLKPEYRLVFLLHYEEAWSIARISEFLALPVTTIQWRLHQARKQLKQQLLLHERDSRHE